VIEQDPVPGTQMTRGDGSVTLTVGVAPPPVVVPTLAGMTVSEAQDALEAQDLILGSQIPESSSEFGEDEVTRSEPAAGDEVDPRTAINIYVSTGPALVIVPDVSRSCATTSSCSSSASLSRRTQNVPTPTGSWDRIRLRARRYLPTLW